MSFGKKLRCPLTAYNTRFNIALLKLRGKEFRMRQTLPDKSKKSDKWKELCVTTRHESQKSDNILSLRNALLASSSVQTRSTGSGGGEKLSGCAGGHAYRESSRVGSSARNRFISWRSQGNVLELTEESLDYNLNGNHLRLRFSGAHILPGISVHEGHGCVVILVATTASVHRLIFPHPNKLDKYDIGRSAQLASIFADWSVAHVNEATNCYTIQNPAAATYKIHTSGAWMTSDGHALFALGTNAGSIVFVKMPPFGIQGVVSQNELRQSSVMQRLWTGLMPSVISGGHEASDTALGIIIHPLGQDTYIFAVCQDHKLRMWSCKSLECVMVSDLLEFTPDNMDPTKITSGAEGHMIRKCVSTTQMLQIGVFLSFSDRAQFCVLQPVMADGRHQLKHITSIFAPQEDLIDFCMTSNHVWTTWTDAEGETAYRAAPTTGDLPAVQKWQDVFVDEDAQLSEVVVPDHQDPREAYIDHIFNGPARFSANVVHRALKLYRRALDASVVGQSVLEIDTVKAEVILVVEHEIQSCASEYEMSDEEYYQLQLQQWNKFFSCCLQYHQQDNTPVACFADNGTGMVTVIKKGAYSYLRPCHMLEHITLSSTLYMEQFYGFPVLTEDEQLCRDVISLSGLLHLVQSCMSAEMLYLFRQDIQHNQAPEQSAQQIVSAIMAHTSTGGVQSDVAEKLRQIELRLHEVQDVVKAVDFILQFLDVMQGNQEQMNDSMVEANRQLSSSHLFASQTAVDILVRCVQQQCNTRMTLATNTLMLLTLMCHLGDQANLQLGVTEKIRSELIGRAGQMVQVHNLLYWTSTELANHVSSATLETNARAMEALGLTESVSSPNIHKYGDQRIGILELYLCGHGGTQLRSLVAQQGFLEEDSCPLWSQALLQTSSVLMQLIWPMNMSFDFPESLLVECQFSKVQNYVRLSQDWCTDWNMSSRKFGLAYAYLSTMEPYKALDCFFEVVHGLGNEEFLIKLLNVASEISVTHLEILYYLKVIKLFEEFTLPQIVVTMATSAISIADEDDPNVPTLWSKIFKHQLLMGHSDEAYAAMIANPDPSRRKDCLRQLLVVLCERGELQQLVQFPYIDLESDVVTILESRARSVDLTTHNYYDLLYAFHVFRNNYRKAGSVMYEYGMRLAQEVPGRKGLQRQAKCFLAAMNALRLVNENYAWIVKPVTTDNMMETEEGGRSPKHSLSGMERHMQMKRRMEVLKLEDIEQEYMLVHARLQLLQRDPDSTQIAGGSCSAQETISLLVNAGMFDCAINICKLFNLPLTPIFEGLASRCIKLSDGSYDFMQGDNEYTAQAWEWLEQNELTAYTAHKDLSSGDQAWRLLQTYLKKYDEEGSRHHKTVALTLLSHGFNLPNWFIASYKRLNAAELLRLYIDFDLLEEAAHLTMEYIDAVLGAGPEYFGLKNPLQYNLQPVWLPYTCIDQLRIALKDGDIDTSYTELSSQLNNKLKLYKDRVEKASQDRAMSARSTPMVM